MNGQTIILASERQRVIAKQLIDRAPPGAVLNVREAKRTVDQNAKMWAMLSDISRAKPLGRKHTPETWKCIFMNALGHAVRFEPGLEGEPFPVGFRSSNLTKRQMIDLIDFVTAFAAEHGVPLSDSQERQAA